MAKHIKNSRAKYLRMQETALNKLAELDASLVADFRAATAALQELDTPDSERYLRKRSTKEAIIACLKHENRWMTKPEIADALFNGGFIMHPVRGKRLISDSAEKAVKRGAVLERDGKIGLLEWASEKSDK